MKETDIRKIEAWFDGEVSPDESEQVESLLKDDPHARSYLEELEETRDLLKEAHAPTQVPRRWMDVREQFAGIEQTASKKVIGFPRMAGAAAAIVLIGMALWWPMRKAGMQSVLTGPLDVSVEFVETDLEGATPVVYLDQPSGWTVVWVVQESATPES